MMMMILRNLVAVWARTRRSMGEPYLRSLELLLVDDDEDGVVDER